MRTFGIQAIAGAIAIAAVALVFVAQSPKILGPSVNLQETSSFPYQAKRVIGECS